MSELYGRKLPLVVGSFGFAVFSLAVAVGKDLQTVLIGRFFAGLFGACPLSVVAAVYADIFNNVQRGLAIGAFSATVFMGPMVSSMISMISTFGDNADILTQEYSSHRLLAASS